MRRLLVLVCSLLAILMAGRAIAAGLSKGDKRKLGREAGTYLSPDSDVKDDDRAEAKKKFVDFFSSRRKADDLADVVGLTEVLANAGERDSRRGGVTTVSFEATELTPECKVVVSVPKKYEGDGEGWPLIFCVPDKGPEPKKGEKPKPLAQSYLDKYWSSPAIRQKYVIAVLEFDYSEIEKTEQVAVKDEEGEVKYETKVSKTPFEWTAPRAKGQWWRSLLGVMVIEFKIDPNRVILDGAGLGATGNLSLAVSDAWRFAGLILRGGEYEGDALSNLAHLSVLTLPYPTATENSKKTAEALKKIAGERFTPGTNEPKWSGAGDKGTELMNWLDGCVRDRYPLPTTWTYTEAIHQIGYWVFINKVHDTSKPASITVSSDKKENVVTVDADNVEEFNLYLNDVLVDLGKPFKVVVNGEERTFDEKKRSAADVLDHAAVLVAGKAPYDPGVVFTAEIIGLKAAPKKDEGEKKDGEKDEGEKDEGEKKDGEEKGGD
jgi:hypothetical protein